MGSDILDNILQVDRLAHLQQKPADGHWMQFSLHPLALAEVLRHDLAEMDKLWPDLDLLTLLLPVTQVGLLPGSSPSLGGVPIALAKCLDPLPEDLEELLEALMNHQEPRGVKEQDREAFRRQLQFLGGQEDVQDHQGIHLRPAIPVQEGLQVLPNFFHFHLH